MDIIAEIRRRHFVSGESISSIARSLKISRPTVRKHLATKDEPVYQRQIQPSPKLGEYKAQLLDWLEADVQLPKHQRRTAQRLFEGLVGKGYQGAYDSVQRFVKQWKRNHQRSPSIKQAFIPLAFQPGEVCQFDWSQDDCMDAGGRATQEQLPKRWKSMASCRPLKWPISAWRIAEKCLSLPIRAKPRKWSWMPIIGLLPFMAACLSNWFTIT